MCEHERDRFCIRAESVNVAVAMTVDIDVDMGLVVDLSANPNLHLNGPESGPGCRLESMPSD